MKLSKRAIAAARYRECARHSAGQFLLLLLCALGMASSTRAEVVALAIKQVAPAFDGRTFGGVGAYERIEAVAHFRVDANHLLNAGIVNVQYAPRESDGRVAFDVDVVLLRPVNRAKASGVLVFEPVNRGYSLLLNTFNNAVGREAIAGDAGDGWLMTRGHTLVIAGWQVDYPVQLKTGANVALGSRLVRMPGVAVLGARLPIAHQSDGSALTGLNREQFLDVGANATSIGYLTYPAANLDAAATLNVRERDEDPRSTPPGLRWRYLDEWRVEITRPTDVAPSAGAIYEFIYTAKDPVVYGLGLASMRDLVAFLRYDASAQNPLAASGKSTIKTTLGFGGSQTGRTMKELLYEFNEDERGRIVFDGMHINISGAGKNAVNSSFARPGQKDAQHAPSRLRGDEFPFSYAVTFDPLSRKTDGVLARCSGSKTCPKVMHVDSENEIWHGGALTFVDANGRDLPLPDNVRAYVFAGAEHSASAQAAPPLCQVLQSTAIDWRPLNRALFAALEEWVAGRAPPPSRYPQASQGELVASDRASVGFPNIPNVAYTGVVDARYLLDFSVEPPRPIAPYPRLAPRVDADGTMRAGVRHPFVQAPLATHTGWNLRREGMGEGELCVASGMRIAFAKTKVERDASGDPRASIDERYPDEQAYAAAVRRAANELMKDRLLLPEDASAITQAAIERYRTARTAQ